VDRSQLPIRNPAITNPQLLRDASGPSCSEEQVGGGRNARACQSRYARFWKFFPSAIRFRELPAATGSAAIIQQDQERSRFAESTVVQFRVMGNKKFHRICAKPVDDANSLWKAEEN